jgi:hypothetical protein
VLRRVERTNDWFGCFAQALVAALQPDTFFAQFGDPKTHQITLAQAKEYEQAMKDKLETMAKDGKLADTVRAKEERGPRKGATSQILTALRQRNRDGFWKFANRRNVHQS